MKFTMYHNFSDYVRDKGIEEASEIALRLGFSSVEMLASLEPGFENPVSSIEEAKQIRTVLDKYHLPMSCYSVYVDLWRSPEKEKALMKQVEIAAALGSPYFHHTLLPCDKNNAGFSSYEEAVDEIVEVAARIADYADTFGITCIYEDQGYYVNGVEGFGKFWNRIKKRCENVGICGDLGNILFVNETPQAFLEAYIEDICHVHIKDYLWKNTANCPGKYWSETKDGSWVRDTMVGSGVVDFEACMDVLKKGGYQGRFALENFHPEPYEEGVFQAIQYINAVAKGAFE